MPSGAILGDCPICNEFVWEDQRYEGIPLIDVRHFWCDRKKKLEQKQQEEKIAMHVENERLKKRIKELEKEIRSGQLTLF